MTHQPGVYVPLRALFLVFFSVYVAQKRFRAFVRTKTSSYTLHVCFTEEMRK